MQYKKPYLTLPEAVPVCGCGIATLIAAASEGVLKAYVIADRWPAASREEPVSGYVQLLPGTMLQALGKSQVVFEEGVLDSDIPIRFDQSRSLYFGQVYVRTIDAEGFQPVQAGAGPSLGIDPPTRSKEPGPKATLNLERTIGALTLLIVQDRRNKDFLNGIEPNVSKIAEAVRQMLTDKNIGPDEQGFSASSLQHRISAGLKALEKL